MARTRITYRSSVFGDGVAYINDGDVTGPADAAARSIARKTPGANTYWIGARDADGSVEIRALRAPRGEGMTQIIKSGRVWLS